MLKRLQSLFGQTKEFKAHLLVVTESFYKLLNRDWFLISEQVALCCQSASVYEDVGIGCSNSDLTVCQLRLHMEDTRDRLDRRACDACYSACNVVV